MIFQYPPALFLLFLIPVLILLHSIRTRRRNAEVSSLLLWNEVLKASGRRFQLKKLLRDLSLLLQIIAAVLLTAALARPAFLRESPSSGNVVLIMDTSASMKSREGNRSRMETAKRLAREAVIELGAESSILLIEARSVPVLLSPYTQDRDRITAIIAGIDATDEPGAMREAYLMALSLADAERGDEVWIATDGAFETFEEIGLAGVDVHLLRTGGGDDNLAITRFEFRSLPARPEEYEILVNVGNFTAGPAEVPLRLLIDGKEYETAVIPLDRGEEKSLIFTYRGLIAETAVAEIDAADSLSTDNRAYAVLSESRGIRVLLLSPGNPFLEAVLSVYPNTRLDMSVSERDYGEYDMVVFDRTDPPPLVSGNFLLIDTLAEELPLRRDGVLENPDITWWERGHPVLRSVNLQGVRIQESARVILQGRGETLVSAAGSPLLVAYESRRLRILYLGFDLLRSDLPLKSAFPVLIGNILRWFYPGGLSSAARQVQAGTPYAITPKGFKFDVGRPDGDTETLAPLENPFLYDNTGAVGFYAVRGAEIDESFAVNLVSPEESDIRPRFEPELPLPGGEPAAEQSQSRTPFAFAFLLACLAVVLAEGFHWTRQW